MTFTFSAALARDDSSAALARSMTTASVFALGGCFKTWELDVRGDDLCVCVCVCVCVFTYVLV